MNEEYSFAQFLKGYKWRIVGFITMLLVGILFLTLGFWKTLLIILLCTIGVGIGYAKDRTTQFLIFFDKLR